jgi:hypothetical protein
MDFVPALFRACSGEWNLRFHFIGAATFTFLGALM